MACQFASQADAVVGSRLNIIRKTFCNLKGGGEEGRKGGRGGGKGRDGKGREGKSEEEGGDKRRGEAGEGADPSARPPEREVAGAQPPGKRKKKVYINIHIHIYISKKHI